MSDITKACQELRSLLGKATKGPWNLNGKYVIRGPQDPGAKRVRENPVVVVVRANQKYRHGEFDENNAALIVSMRNNIEKILDELEGKK